MQFPDADIHKWIGYELLILISPPIKGKPAQQWKFPGKQGFFSVLRQPSPKCSSLQPTALMDAALLSFPGDSSQHYSSFSRSNQSSRASSCCCLVYSPLWSNTGTTFSLPHPHSSHTFFWGGGERCSTHQNFKLWFLLGGQSAFTKFQIFILIKPVIWE